MRASLVLCLAMSVTAVILGSAAAATNRPPTGNGLEQIHSPEWPTVAAQLAKNIARASFAHDYAAVWRYLHPTYQKAVSQSNWHKCLRSHPAAPRNVTITNVSVAQATDVPVRLSLLGRQSIQEIELLVRFKTPSSAGPQLAVLNTFWLKQGKSWTAVWLSDEYNAYKAGTCYLTPQGPPLY